MENTGVLYGVGVGPGDPELLTIKAVRAMERCAIIALPDSGAGASVALAIAGEYVRGKRLLYLDMPMTCDRQRMEASHGESVRRLIPLLRQGDDVAFLTLGDPSVYSTYLYLHRLVLQAGYKAEMIPGVPSFCAAAAALNTGLCEGEEQLHILPASRCRLDEFLELPGTKVLMKSGKKAEETLELLERRKLLEHTSLVERCGLEGERVEHSPGPGGEPPGYFTTMVVWDRNRQQP